MVQKALIAIVLAAAMAAVNLSPAAAGPSGSGATDGAGTKGETKPETSEKVPGGTTKERRKPNIECTETGTKKGVRGTLDCKAKE